MRLALRILTLLDGFLIVGVIFQLYAVLWATSCLHGHWMSVSPTLFEWVYVIIP